MINYYLNFILFISAIICNFLIYKYGLLIVLKDKDQPQNIHFNATSRLGGLVIFFNFVLFVLLYERSLTLFLIMSLIFFLPALYEDLNYDIRPIIRLFLIIIGSLMVVLNIDQLPQFQTIFSSFLNNYYFQIIFYTLCLATVINGQNIIDGTNGLSAFTGISIFGSLLYIGLLVNDYQLVNITIITINLLTCFLIFNYPYGKIFLGDCGSYFIGVLGGYLTIYVFGKYPELPTWSAVIILYYPTQEVIFSYFRKIIYKKSPFKADNSHLHLKIFYLLKINKKPSKLYNALVAPFLSILWLSPLALTPFAIQNHTLAILALILLGFIYLFLYLAIPNPSE